MCEKLGISLPNAHDALGDVRATREVYYKLIELFKKYVAFAGTFNKPILE
jgi:DNA polymerase III epsilon subunit-like protein